MAIILDNYTVEQQGHIELDVRYSFDVLVSAETARKTTARWLHDQISMQLSAQTPMLVIGGEQPVWRVPVRLSLPTQGIFAVTTVDVDTTTAQPLDIEAAHTKIIEALEKEVKPYLNLGKMKPRELPPNYLDSLNPPPQRLSS